MIPHTDRFSAGIRKAAAHTEGGSVPAASRPAGAWQHWAQLAAYLSLTKPRIISLVLVTTLGSMVLAGNGLPPVQLLVLTLVGGALGAGAANAVNCCLDRDIDAIMSRTASRAIPSGAVRPEHAMLFGLVLAAASFVILVLGVNLLAASLTLGAFAFYVVVYTWWLKRATVHSIVIGGAAGAIPPLVGWAAVTGEVSLLAFCLFAIIFLWTPPHFWALSLLIKDDYARAGIPMLPVVRGEEETRLQIVLYSAVLFGSTIAIYAFGLLGFFYLGAAVILGGLLIACAVWLLNKATDRAARTLFRYSILYLALLFTSMVIDRQITPS